jgi:hypothetical protein
VVSLRNQDAVVKIDSRRAREVAWIAGVPDNWPPAYADSTAHPRRFTVSRGSSTNTPRCSSTTAPRKRLLVYDNGNAQTTPYSVCGAARAPQRGAAPAGRPPEPRRGLHDRRSRGHDPAGLGVRHSGRWGVVSPRRSATSTSSRTATRSPPGDSCRPFRAEQCGTRRRDAGAKACGSSSSNPPPSTRSGTCTCRPMPT